MFRSKREKGLEELCVAYRSQISELEKRPEAYALKVPGEDDQINYWLKLSSLVDDEMLLFHFARMRKEILRAFVVQGKEYSEFFRGKLACLDDIEQDAKNARLKYRESLAEVK